MTCLLCYDAPMEIRLKKTNVTRAPQLTAHIAEKLLLPLRRLFDGKQSAATVDIELAQITAHHRTGKIWKCEVTMTFPGLARSLRIEVIEETLDHAIDKAKDRVERAVKRLLGKRRTRVRSGARVFRRG